MFGFSAIVSCYLNEKIYTGINAAFYMSESSSLIQLGHKIREFRISKKMTQDELATACGFEKARISRMENGYINSTILSLYKISEALEIKVRELFPE